MDKSSLFMGVFFVTTPLHFLWCEIFVNYFKLGLLGIGLASTTTSFLNFFITHIVCLVNHDLKQTYFKATIKEVITDLSTYIRFGAPCAALLVLDWGQFEILAIYAGYIGVVANGT